MITVIDRPIAGGTSRQSGEVSTGLLTYPGLTYVSPLCNNEAQLTAFRPLGSNMRPRNIIEHLSDPQNCTSCATCVQPSTRNCHHTDASSSQMWPWRVNQSYERNLDGTLEAKPSLVMHRE